MISMQLSMTVAESQVEDYAAVYGARLAPALVKCLRTLLWLDPSDCLPIDKRRPVSNRIVSGTDARCDANMRYIGVVTITSDV